MIILRNQTIPVIFMCDFFCLMQHHLTSQVKDVEIHVAVYGKRPKGDVFLTILSLAQCSTGSYDNTVT
jgi:hypothetical protein